MLSLVLLLQATRTPITVTLDVNGAPRTALVYAPATSKAMPPVIFGFHGHMGNSRNAARSFDLQSAWPDAIVVYPEGLPTKSFYDPQGRFNGWSPEATNSNRDLQFFDALYSKVMGEYHADPRRVFAMGHSNGAQFIYTLWTARVDKFAALGSCEGAGGRSAKLTPKPFFITIGDGDKLAAPALQRASRAAVVNVDGSEQTGKPYGPKGTQYAGRYPVVLWAYHGGHAFPSDCVPTMVQFFKSVR